MRSFVLRRFASGAGVVLLVSFLIFALSRMAGDPRELYVDEYTTAESYAAMGKVMGLDKPLVVQYLIWIGKAVRGDFGRSLFTRTAALPVILERVPATFQLTAGAFVFALVTGIPLGVMSAVKRGSLWDYLGRAFALYGQALPAFWLGIVLILVFAVQLGWLPTGQRGGWTHYVLPSVTLGWGASAGFVRLTRSAMLEVLDSEFVKLARAKGVREHVIVWKHTFRNALIAPLTYAGVLLAAFLTGAIVTESVFAWPGLGRLAVRAVFNNDFPVMTGVVMFFTGFYVLVNFLVDLLYAFIDPRIRYT
ncbi:MAG: ABC transporter permease [Chloroflexi bacterium]|nr:ABC transporter permease [Chloroflexota bacterium]